MEKLVSFGILVFIVWICIDTRAQLKVEDAVHQQNVTLLKDAFLPDSANRGYSDKTEEWIQKNISTENKDVFQYFAKDLKKMVTLSDNKSEFFDLDERLVYYPFCIQGEKDLKQFEIFMNDIVYETELEKKILIVMKKKYNYDQKQLEKPSENDIMEFCGFKKEGSS